MKLKISKALTLLGATLLLANCGKKNFNQDLQQASAAPVQNSAGTMNPTPDPNPAPTPGTNTPPSDQAQLLAGDACIATIQWYDGFDWIPWVSDQDCVSKMKVLVRAQTGDLTMMNFEIRHVPKAQLVSIAGASASQDAFVAQLLKQTTPIYGFYGGWINE